MRFPPLLSLLFALPAFSNPIGSAADDRPLVVSNQLRRLLTRSSLLRQADVLEYFSLLPGANGNRAFGGIGHNATINWLFDTISALPEYTVSLQPFKAPYSASTGTFLIDGESDSLFYASRNSPNASGVRGRLAVAGGNREGCNDADYETHGSVRQKIVLVKRGNCSYTAKSQLAGRKGALGVVVYNDLPGTVLDGRLLDEKDIVPTGSIGNDYGLKLVERVSRGESIRAELNIATLKEERLTYNVIAQTTSGDQKNVVVLGAHSDSVPLGPGINDNGSGTIALLEVLLNLKRFRTKNAIRFLWFAAEEYGLLGSNYYVNTLTREENYKIRMMLNFDMLASPNYILGVYDGSGAAYNITGPAGSDRIQSVFEAFFKDVGKTSVPTAFTGRSDYGPFLRVGIPSGGLFTGAEGIKTEEEQNLFGGEVGEPYDANYHQPGDARKNVDREAWITNAKAIADSVAVWGGGGLERFPNRREARWQAEWVKGSHGKMSGCGDGLY
ncbi:Similar to Leucine aminopeptidase 2; acc. no. A7UI09 [Pyronema omphalodes CBS 100304]|uniref:Peptide hydrolase n=1 Tax=Pyronema omphalodes (strain CBS 100304) TaxID=1076935 RepID=U4LKS9_PYROM|nr:Similar to Leucine aminopeptidase 2; acc. no. A7UI09 [Pyronema omphalodes CBS 100304]